MGIRTIIPPGATPIAAVDAIMAMFGRENVELAIDVLIERLDRIDGDPDLEDDNEDRCPAGDDEPVAARCVVLLGAHEDDEEDDHAGGNIFDEPHDGPDEEQYGYLVSKGAPGWADNDPRYAPYRAPQ